MAWYWWIVIYFIVGAAMSLFCRLVNKGDMGRQEILAMIVFGGYLLIEALIAALIGGIRFLLGYKFEEYYH